MTRTNWSKQATPTLLILALMATSGVAEASKLLSVGTLDDEHIEIRWADSEVFYKDDGKGPGAFMGHESQGGDRIVQYTPPLHIPTATAPRSYTITSPDDPEFRLAVQPVQVFRKAKVSGTAWKWPDPDTSIEHTMWLKLPKKLRSGMRYVLRMDVETGSSSTRQEFTFDETKSLSEAIHVNTIGYNPNHTVIKAADLYAWMGDGGARDYSAYLDRPVRLYDVSTGKTQQVGRVTFGKASGNDYGGWNYTRSDVWNCDFSAFKGTGRFRLVIDGVGCSQDFEIKPNIYREPYKTSVQGFYYMRIGEPMTLKPPPRQPRFIPNVDPPGFTVYLTTYGPWHPDWKKGQGDQWDVKDWSKYKEPGNPTNPNAYGGHSDAADWDRHAGHISIIWDLLLPYLLSNGKLSDDDLGILESGNGVPDLIDEARNEVDFWLRLRDQKGGYSSGLNNPSDDHKIMYQAAARPYMAWASACNAAMLAAAYGVANKPELMRKYRDAALEAWKIADGQDLDEKHGIGNGVTRGRDLKMMAAAHLYIVTGERRFEDAMAQESVIRNATSETDLKDTHNQLWGTAAYLMCAKHKWRPIHQRGLLANMSASILHEAFTKNVANTEKWPSRRSSDNEYGWFQTIQEVQRVCVAHAIAPGAQKGPYLKALLLEADWGLGRNPMNMVQMTGLGRRYVTDIYTSGRNDGYPGVHPGHTPYMNANNWGSGFMADPQWMASRGYPEWSKWPHGEAFWRARYCYSNNEFTPQQSMRGKMCLLAYLYSLSRGG